MEMMKASQQWSTRPADERYWTLSEMREKAARYKAEGRIASVDARSLRLKAIDDTSLVLNGSTGTEANLTHYSFGQLCGLVGAPSGYLRSLPAPLTADCLNNGIQTRQVDDKKTIILFNKNGDLKARCFTSEHYERIWNCDILDRLIPLENDGWRTPPARPATKDAPNARIATKDDLFAWSKNGSGLQVKEGDVIAPAGLYMSDRDMFCFLVNDKNPIDNGGGAPMYRGFFIEASEVGAASQKITTFLFNSVCGNHIVWGAKQVNELRVIHKGSDASTKAWRSLQVTMTKYADESASDFDAKIKAAKVFELGKTKEDVIDLLFGKRISSRGILADAFDTADAFRKDSGNAAPNTAWGMVNGMTRLSQESNHMDARADIDNAAGKILEMAF